MVKELAVILLELLSSEPNTAENNEQLRKLLARLRQRHPEIFSDASSDVVSKKDEGDRGEIEQLILSLSAVSVVTIAVCNLLMPLPLDEPGLYTIKEYGGEGFRTHNSICRLGPEYTNRGSTGSIGGGRGC